MSLSLALSFPERLNARTPERLNTVARLPKALLTHVA
jgi:hypothetical protein